jgi:hypothetical protein
MISNKKRIRKTFDPLTVAVSVRCTTPASPLTQVFNGYNQEYEPNRQLTPTILYPEVIANAADGSWLDPAVNAKLADIVWLVDGADITTLSDWSGLYEINTNGNDRGTLTIKKNVTSGEAVRLQFKATLPDTRLGYNIPVLSDVITLSTSTKSEDDYTLSIRDSNLIEYDIIKDKHSLNEYKRAHGLTATSDDTGSYYHAISLTLYKGTTAMGTGEYTVKLYKVNSSGGLTQGPEEAISIGSPVIVLDLRLVTQADYVIKAYVDSKEVASVQFSVNRVYQAYNIRPTNGTDIHPNDTLRYDEAMVDCDGNIVECPGRALKINWYTDSAAKTAVAHNEGDTTKFKLAKTGIGDDADDSVLDVYCTSEYKEAHSIAKDSDGNILMESGTTWIFN